MLLQGSAQLGKACLRRGLPFSLLSSPEQTFGEKAYFCTRELDMSQKSSLIQRLLGLLPRNKALLPPDQGGCVQAACGEGSLAHAKSQGAPRNPLGCCWLAWAKTMPGPMPAIWQCGQLCSSYLECSLCLFKSLARKKTIHLLHSTQNPEA